MKKSIIILTLAASLMVGCSARKQYALKLRGAHEALVADFPELAEHRLKLAQQIADENKLPASPSATLLLAEAKIQSGNIEAAKTLAQGILGTSDPGSRERGQSEEVLGKIAINEGDFAAAGQHLANADQNYSSEADKARVADLGLVVSGFKAYAAGDIEAARRSWDEISDAQLKFSVEAALVENRILVGIR